MYPFFLFSLVGSGQPVDVWEESSKAVLSEACLIVSVLFVDVGDG
jgi:hypothetical protein